MASIHNYLGRLDFEKPWNVELADMGRFEKNVLVAQNSVHAAFETANSIPGISAASGAASVVIGIVELVVGVVAAAAGLDVGGQMFRGGFKLAALGAAAASLPGAGNVINAAFAAGDVVDTLNAAG